MRCVILLVRHALTDAVDVRLTSRQLGVRLNARGLGQVAELRESLRHVPLAAIYSSPLERALATASPIAATHALEVRALDALNEVDFGEWTGCTLEELSALAAWRDFNAARGSADVPGGERAIDVQRRIVAALDRLRQRHAGAILPQGTGKGPQQATHENKHSPIIAAVSHAEVIRAAVLHATATPLDLWHRFEIAPASITTVGYDDGHARLLAVNEAPARFALNVRRIAPLVGHLH